MYIDFLFDKILSENFILAAFKNIVARQGKTIEFLQVASENNLAYNYLLEYETIENSGLCLSVTLCGYSPEI